MTPGCIVGLLYRDVNVSRACGDHTGVMSVFTQDSLKWMVSRIWRPVAPRWRGTGNAGVAPTSAGRHDTSKSPDLPHGRWLSSPSGNRHRLSYAELLAVLGVALLAFALADAAAMWPNFNPD